MINTTDCNAKKTTGLGDLFKDYAPQQLEEQKNLPPSHPALKEAFEHYEQVLAAQEIVTWYPDKEGLYPSWNIQTILPASLITAFAIEANKKYAWHEYHHNRIGSFVGKLIQNSYLAGHNDFLLDMSDSSPCNFMLGFCVKGIEDNPIRARISGNVGDYCALRAEYLHLVLEANAGMSLAQGVQHCAFTLQGKLSPFSFAEDAVDVIFKTSDPQQLEHLCTYISRLRGCDKRIIFVHANGIEEVIE